MARDRYSVIVGTGRYVPTRRVVNEDFIGNRFYKGYGEAIDPATNRIFIRFKDANTITRGSTSVAVQTP